MIVFYYKTQLHTDPVGFPTVQPLLMRHNKWLGILIASNLKPPEFRETTFLAGWHGWHSCTFAIFSQMKVTTNPQRTSRHMQSACRASGRNIWDTVLRFCRWVMCCSYKSQCDATDWRRRVIVQLLVIWWLLLRRWSTRWFNNMATTRICWCLIPLHGVIKRNLEHLSACLL